MGVTVKDFTSLTRDELIEGIVNMHDPDICQNKRLMLLVNLDNESGENLYALTIRDEQYLVAELDWKYYNEEDSVDLVWGEVTREKFRQHIYDDLNRYSLNKLRAEYQVARKDVHFIKRITNTGRMLSEAVDEIISLETELMERITNVSHIPEEYAFVGTVAEKVTPSLIDEYGIDSNISIWETHEGSMLLTADKGNGYIESLAYKELGVITVFKNDESRRGLRAIISSLTETMSDEDFKKAFDE